MTFSEWYFNMTEGAKKDKVTILSVVAILIGLLMVYGVYKGLSSKFEGSVNINTTELEYELAEDIYKAEVALVNDLIRATTTKYSYDDKKKGLHISEIDQHMGRLNKAFVTYKIAKDNYILIKKGE